MLMLIAVMSGLTMAGPGLSPDQAAFESLKGMSGEWRQVGRARPLTIRYRTISGGSAVVETWMTYSGHETMNVFHMDRGRLIATHYCAMGNQPTLQLASSDGTLHFAFRSATNLPTPDQSHQHALGIRRDGDRLERTETYSADGEDTVTRFELTRAPESDRAAD